MLQYVTTGLASGSIYALMGIAMVLTFRCTNVLNFAQGEISMLMTFVVFSCLTVFGLGLASSLVISFIASLLLGAFIYLGIVYPIRVRDLEALAFSTLALKLSINGLAALIWGPAAQSFPPIFTPDRYAIFGTVIAAGHLFAIILCLGFTLAVTLFLRFTTFGMCMRASAENSQIAQLLGIDIRLVGMAAWMAAAVIGLATGVLLSTTTLISPYMMGLTVVKVFAAVLLGGMTSVVGAAVGGLMLGLLEAFVSFFFDPLFQDATALLALIAILLIRPQGLFGTKAAWRA